MIRFLQIDPSMSAILSDFQPAKCSVANHSMDAGAENCSWSSCRGGCTRELFKCYQVRVRYAPNDSGSGDYGVFSDAQERRPFPGNHFRLITSDGVRSAPGRPGPRPRIFLNMNRTVFGRFGRPGAPGAGPGRVHVYSLI